MFKVALFGNLRINVYVLLPEAFRRLSRPSSALGKAQYSAFAILVFLPISTHFTAPPEIPCTSTFLKSRSFFCGASVELKYFTKDFLNRLQTLYAQSFRITLASSVLPRLLAQS
ncbi:unnamed protein product [Bathycoccus prasinos]